MATLFTKIIAGELPGRFVWKDERVAAFLTIHPIRPGHTLVVTRKEIDHWLDLEPELLSHVMSVAQAIGKAIHHAFRPGKVGLMVAGLEVPHTHLHLIPIDRLEDLSPANQNMNPDPRDLDRAAETIRASLRSLGYSRDSD